MWNHLFKHVNIKQENVHILDGNSEDLDDECSKFEADIVKLGGIELFLGGKVYYCMIFFSIRSIFLTRKNSNRYWTRWTYCI